MVQLPYGAPSGISGWSIWHIYDIEEKWSPAKGISSRTALVFPALLHAALDKRANLKLTFSKQPVSWPWCQCKMSLAGMVLISHESPLP